MSERQHLPYPGGPPARGRNVLDVAERSLVLTGTLFTLLGLNWVAGVCLLLALACILPGLVVRAKRAVSPHRRGRPPE